MSQPATDRLVTFIVDPRGNSGKSWFVRYCFDKLPDETQMLRDGSKSDMAHAIDPDKSIFLFDIARTSMANLDMKILEELKDRMVFSPKYNSRLKRLSKIPHVVVFSNEAPDMDMLTEDRYKIVEI